MCALQFKITESKGAACLCTGVRLEKPSVNKVFVKLLQSYEGKMAKVLTVHRSKLVSIR